MDAMNIVGWVVLGGLAGWIASKFVGTDKQQGLVGNIAADERKYPAANHATKYTGDDIAN
jgi:hypothetical protein